SAAGGGRGPRLPGRTAGGGGRRSRPGRRGRAGRRLPGRCLAATTPARRGRRDRARLAGDLAPDLPPAAEHLVDGLEEQRGIGGDRLRVELVLEGQDEGVAVDIPDGRLADHGGGAWALPAHHREDFVPDAAYGGRVDRPGDL